MQTTDEYDAFGPWIDEVHSCDDLPRLYRDAGVDPAAQRLVLKVPRNIARRDATPNMDLYDHLVVVGQDALTVLGRTDDSYSTVRVPFDEIVGIENSVSLLAGRLTLHSANGGPVSIPYNGAAEAPVEALVGLLRSLYLPPQPDPEAAPASSEQGRRSLGADFGDDDVLLVSAYQALARDEPRMRLVGSLPRRVVTPFRGRFGRLMYTIWPVTLQASITVADDREIQVIHRPRWFTRREAATLSLARTVLPLSRIESIEVDPHDRYEQVRLVTVHAGAARVRFPTPVDPAADAILARFQALTR